MSHLSLKVLFALTIALAATFVTQTMRAQVQTLDITEKSSTSLSAILNGTTPVSVTFNRDNNWTITLNGVSGADQDWMEPDAAGFVNLVEFDGFHQNELFVVSDFNHPGGIPDGTPDTTHFTLGRDALTVTFFDKGDVAAVPDTGTTASLFGFSLAGLAFLRRKLA